MYHKDFLLKLYCITRKTVLTAQVSLGSLESTAALKGAEKFLPRPGIKPGRASVLPVQRANHYTTKSLVLFPCNPQYLLEFLELSSSDKSDCVIGLL